MIEYDGEVEDEVRPYPLTSAQGGKESAKSENNYSA